MQGLMETTYWMAVAHLPKWPIEKINRLIIQIVHEHKMTWADFFALDPFTWQDSFALTGQEVHDLATVSNNLPYFTAMAEELERAGCEVIPINSPAYSPALKEHLKIAGCPPVLYAKGNKALLQQPAVAIVGARKAGSQALAFTNQVAKNKTQEQQVIVSGFARGVDRQALDSALQYGGKSIIVLPQGILTFQTWLQQYRQPIANGDLLVISTFYPTADWEVGLAMARNTYIYGLAREIYVAESDSKGGTWQGVQDGLKRKRAIYIRIPEPSEQSANQTLIGLGGIPVDQYGAIMK